MNTAVHAVDPVVRRNLKFKLDEAPRFWFGNDPFRTRMFDALSLAFPDGERYFIESVRLYQSQIQDPELAARVQTFIQQEAQHGIAHEKANQILRAQGMPIDGFLFRVKRDLKLLLKHLPAELNIALTASYEHLTALMADTFFSHQSTTAEMHPYVRALFAWHAVEEMEHRDVAFDVMRDVAQVDETTRKSALVVATLLMAYFTFYRTNVMLQRDGFSATKRLSLFAQGLPWFLGRRGKLTVMYKAYFAWFKTGFHPSQQPMIHTYSAWLDALSQSADPIQAGDAMWRAAKPD